jgi:RNA polymerase-binding transcription factor DksA
MIFDFLKNLLGDSFEDNSTSQNTLWSKEELDEFKSILIEEKGITISEIEYLEERIKDIEQYKINEKSENLISDSITFENELITSAKELERVRNYLVSLDNSLKRIDDGTYGICQKCQCKINKERLLAVPTTLSASWKLQGKCPENGVDTLITRKM